MDLPLHKQLSFDFLASFLVRRKEIFPWECMWKPIKLGSSSELGHTLNRSNKLDAAQLIFFEVEICMPIT
jgi:hypothetical protein